MRFFIPRARLVFAKLRQTFSKALILHYFNPQCHIQIGIEISSYTINKVHSQLIFDALSQWHLVIFFFEK